MSSATEPTVLLLTREDGPVTLWEKFGLVPKGIVEFHPTAVTLATVAQAVSNFLASYPANSAILLDHDLVPGLGDLELPATVPVVAVLPEGLSRTQYCQTFTSSGRRALPLLNLANHSPAELGVVLACLTAPASCPGIYPFLEKGTRVYGEKIQSLTEVGTLLDAMAFHIEKEHPALQAGNQELRQLVHSLVGMAFKLTTSEEQKHPTIDLQFACTSEAVALNIRLPFASDSLLDFAKGALNGENFSLHIAWMSGSAMLVSEYKDLKELDLRAFVKPVTEASLPSLLYLASPSPLKAHGLLQPPQDFSFQLISTLAKHLPRIGGRVLDPDLQVRQLDNTDLAVTLKLKEDRFEREKDALQALIKKKNLLITELNRGINAAQRDATGKQNDNLKGEQGQRAAVEKANRLAQDAVEKMRHYRRLLDEEKEQNAKKLDSANVVSKEQHDQALQSMENKYEARVSDLTRRVALFEEKLAKMTKSLTEKSLEANTLKSQNLQAKRDVDKLTREEQLRARGDSATDAKARELKEAQEAVKDLKRKELELHKEVKKLLFKIETNEKTSKSNQLGADKKLVLTERQLEETRRSERSLMKKVEDLSQALRVEQLKASKAS